MMKAQGTRQSFLAITVLIGLIAAPADFQLQAREWRIAQNDLSAQQSIISEREAAAIAQRATGGEVLSVSLKRGKRPFYQVRVILDSKRVKTIKVDAVSGNIR